jgi:hypothetical protein
LGQPKAAGQLIAGTGSPDRHDRRPTKTKCPCNGIKTAGSIDGNPQRKRHACKDLTLVRNCSMRNHPWINHGELR